MTPTNALLFHLLASEGVLLFLIAAIVFGHALWLGWRARRDGPRLIAARNALIDALSREGHSGGENDRTIDHTLRRLPTREQVKLFTGLASSLNGVQRATLTGLALDLGLIARAEDACHSRLWWRRLHGCRLLTAVGGGEAIVPVLLQDRNPDVRAQATEWAATHPNPETVAALVAQLADPTHLDRFSVQDSLLRLGGAAIEPLAQYLATHNGRSVEAALEVAIGLADPRFLTSVLSLCADTEPRVRALAATVIGALGGDETTRVLMELLDDPSDVVRSAAAEGLGRLGYAAAAPALALKLRDRAWGVRRAAGLALREFGAPGLLYLRRALMDSDPYAADMARQLLDLAALSGDAA